MPVESSNRKHRLMLAVLRRHAVKALVAKGVAQHDAQDEVDNTPDDVFLEAAHQAGAGDGTFLQFLMEILKILLPILLTFLSPPKVPNK